MLRRFQKEAQALGWALVYIEIIACYLSWRFFRSAQLLGNASGYCALVLVHLVLTHNLSVQDEELAGLFLFCSSRNEICGFRYVGASSRTENGFSHCVRLVSFFLPLGSCRAVTRTTTKSTMRR